MDENANDDDVSWYHEDDESEEEDPDHDIIHFGEHGRHVRRVIFGGDNHEHGNNYGDSLRRSDDDGNDNQTMNPVLHDVIQLINGLQDMILPMMTVDASHNNDHNNDHNLEEEAQKKFQYFQNMEQYDERFHVCVLHWISEI